MIKIVHLKAFALYMIVACPLATASMMFSQGGWVNDKMTCFQFWASAASAVTGILSIVALICAAKAFIAMVKGMQADG